MGGVIYESRVLEHYSLRRWVFGLVALLRKSEVVRVGGGGPNVAEGMVTSCRFCLRLLAPLRRKPSLRAKSGAITEGGGYPYY